MIQVYIPPCNCICIRIEKATPKAIHKMSFGVIVIHFVNLLSRGGAKPLVLDISISVDDIRYIRMIHMIPELFRQSDGNRGMRVP